MLYGLEDSQREDAALVRVRVIVKLGESRVHDNADVLGPGSGTDEEGEIIGRRHYETKRPVSI